MFIALRSALRSPTHAALFVDEGATVEALRAGRAYRAGDVVVRFEDAERRSQRDRHTVEHPRGGHLFHPELARAAHGCEPNCCISFPDDALVAIRAIAPGEAITFDYQTTESWFSHPFWRLCGARRCRGRIG
jgi:hypothetical protein